MNSYINYYVSNNKLIKRNSINKILVILYAIIKFILDRILSLVGIIILLPFMLIISIIIKIDSKGPVLFKQIRTGKNGLPFTIYKFRTMTNDKVTRFGKLLRSSSLDEIPQLFSILVGKMSFIGPRPWIPEYYENMNNIKRFRYAVKPGLTGLAQAKGRNNISIHEKINYDLEYIQKYSLWIDIKVVCMTIFRVLKHDGIDFDNKSIKKEIEELKKDKE